MGHFKALPRWEQAYLCPDSAHSSVVSLVKCFLLSSSQQFFDDSLFFFSSIKLSATQKSLTGWHFENTSVNYRNKYIDKKYIETVKITEMCA